MLDWEAYEERRRRREEARARRRRTVVRRRRAAAGALVAALLAGAGFAIAGQVGAGASASHPGHRPPGHRPKGGASRGTAPVSVTSAVSAPAAAARRPHGEVTLAAVGDTMLGATPTLPPSPGTYFDGVRSELRGDVVFANLEGTLTDRSEGKCGAGSSSCFAFRAPPSYARYLRRAGFTLVSNANNHSFDYWGPGQADTVDALHRAGLAQTGLPHEVTLVRVRGLRVAFLGFAPYSDTGPLNDPAAAAALVRRADARADLVVVAIHAGAEGTAALHLTGATETYVGENRGDPEAFAHMAVQAGADLVLGSGPHVLRAMEVYHGRLIAYSLGNFAGYHNFSLEGELGVSAILHVTLGADGRFRSGRIASVRLVGAGQPEIDPSGAGASLVAQLSREDLGARGVRLASGGRIQG